MSKLLSSLPVGTLIKDTETKYNDVPISWKIMEHGHEGDPENSTALITERIISFKCFDATEINNIGDSRYRYSNIRQWLNSEKTNWYIAQSSTDNPPSPSHTFWNFNDYENEAGFLNNFSSNFKNILFTINKIVLKNSDRDGSGYENTSDKIFLLSNTEVGFSNEDNITEGSLYSLFNSKNNILSYPSVEAIEKSNFTKESFTSLGMSAPNIYNAWNWWLRTPLNYDARGVDEKGSNFLTHPEASYVGVRPACCIPSSTIVSDTPDSNGVYTILWNENTGDTTDKGENENSSNSSMILWIDKNENIINIYPNEDSTSKIVVEDSLDSTDSTTALSANQGRILNEMIGDIGTMLDNINRKVI